MLAFHGTVRHDHSMRRARIPPARRFSLGRRRSRNPGALAASLISKLVHSLKETRTDYRPVRKPGIKKLASKPAATCFEVALLESRPEGAATCQPRAPPWELDRVLRIATP